MEKSLTEIEIASFFNSVYASYTELRRIYKNIRQYFIWHSLSIVVYLNATVIYIIIINKSSIFQSHYLYIIVQSIFLIFFHILDRHRNNLKKTYIKEFEQGFTECCNLSDITDWGRYRKRYYYNASKQLAIINVINRFYTEFNRYLSPVRYGTKWYDIISLLLFILKIAIFILAIFNYVNRSILFN